MQRDNKEWRFQSWVDRYIDRVVLPPIFVTGIDHAREATFEARQGMAGRGIRAGVPDVFIAQHRAWDLACWLELKRGSRVTAQQEATHNAMKLAGQRVSVCSTMPEVLRALRHFGFELHDNADALADEYEMRVVAKEVAPRTPKTPAKRRAPRVTQATLERWRKNGALV